MSNVHQEDTPANTNETASLEGGNDSAVSFHPLETSSISEVQPSQENIVTDPLPSLITPKKNDKRSFTSAEDPGQILINRFSHWGQQAKDTAVATLFRRSNSSPPTVMMNKSNSNAAQSSASSTIQQSAEVPSPFFAKPTSPDESNVIEIVEEDDQDDATSSRKDTTDDSHYSRRGVTALQWAATNVLDSVQQNTTYFRGRYNRENSTQSELPPQTESTKPIPSQMTRIMSSPHATHMQALMGKNRPPNEFVMLLGRGMLGVNLKQTYLKHQGVYVDYLVHRGSAERSGVIYVGDALLSVGSVDVRKSNIWVVPQTIASAARPVHLILSTCGISSEIPIDRITYVDACLGLLHHYRVLDTTVHDVNPQHDDTSTDSDDDSEDLGTSRGSSHEEEEGDRSTDKMELISPTSFDGPGESKIDNTTTGIIEDVQVELLDSIDQFLNPGIPPGSLRSCVLSHVAKRCNEVGYPDVQNDLSQLAATSVGFRSALRNAFLVCVIDCRRFPFLARHFAQIHISYVEVETETTSDQDNREAFSVSDAMLKMFSDMLNYSALFPLLSRERRKEIADQIAYQYFLPSKVDNLVLVPPTFDFHHIVSDRALRSLESALKEPELLTKDTFMEFQRTVADSLSFETPFLSFLVSNECARMRAYLRNTAPFVNIPFDHVVKQITSESDDGQQQCSFAQNYMLYVLIYLLTLTDQEPFGENDDLLEQNNAAGTRKAGESTATHPRRIEDTAMNLCAYLYLQSSVLPSLHQEWKQPSANAQKNVKRTLGHFWEVFLGPGLGDQHNGEYASKLAHYVSKLSLKSDDSDDILSVDEDLLDIARGLSDELIYDYWEKHHSRFQAHKLHEWLCEELLICGVQNEDNSVLSSPTLANGCIKRLLRKVQWPNGVTPHKPSLQPINGVNKPGTDAVLPHDVIVHNAECAVVFGSVAGHAEQPKRFCCESLTDDALGFLQPGEILPTLEAYATVSQDRHQLFWGFCEESSSCYQVAGWDISLVNFVIPRAAASSENGESSLYGVSLVFRSHLQSRKSENLCKVPISEDESSALREALEVINKASDFKQKVTDSTASAYTCSESLIGLALVSQRNVIPAMRETMFTLVRSFSSSLMLDDESIPQLVAILHNFGSQENERQVLSGFLRPFLSLSSKPWVNLPSDAQKATFIQLTGNQLIDSLPPVQLALLFVSALLEQKIVLSSSRRSILLSAATVIVELLKPLQWCHLFVPRVPTSLASDLLQYPAPFIIGIASEDPGMLDLIRDLPDDITLVDLDVGRVILAASLSNKEEVGRINAENPEDVTRALRLQILQLAQTLGTAIGRSLQPDLWLCDSLLQQSANDMKVSRFDKLSHLCSSFVNELVAGVSSCCFWIEESSPTDLEKTEPTIVLDENRFFKVKQMRYSRLMSQKDVEDQAKHFALSVEDFNLVMELFLRCQSMNEYIGNRQKTEMAYSFY
ncbi:hypothetical protein FisN_4Lh215 [Fistulifera solaris]|uniref:UDENN domain-containing protein n=1 Tax=Fistulifera solaris TaxID=1519565 RepID=A0A1Z5JZ46_FISSO|nr:hypothetical protein FisN_4Lh215 [Fistulifera solaris]|eukprot:GAX19199.1 hypothetical protein FisN_4Lh215 [Fistulifera solaris]